TERVIADASAEPSHEQGPILAQIASDIEHALGTGFVAEPAPAESTEFIDRADTVESIDTAEVAPAMAEVASHEFRSGSLDDFVADLEAWLGNNFLAASGGEPVLPAPPEVPPATTQEPLVRAAAAVSSATPQPEMPKIASFATKASTPSPAAVPPKPPAMSTEAMAGGDLSNLFGGLKQGMEGDAASPDKDPEDQYN